MKRAGKFSCLFYESCTKKGQRRSKAKVEMRVIKQCSCFNFSESVLCGRISLGWWKMNKNVP